MSHNPDFYAYLKAATKETSDLLHSIKEGQIAPIALKKDCVDDIIASKPSFNLCVQFLTENPIAERLKDIQEVEERKEEARKMLLIIIKKILGCPYITIVAIL